MLKKKHKGRGSTAAVPLVVQNLRESEYLRLPKPSERCRLSGLSRTTILEHGEAGAFKLVRIKKRGSQRGIVLVETASFLQWLHGQPPVRKESAK